MNELLIYANCLGRSIYTGHYRLFIKDCVRFQVIEEVPSDYYKLPFYVSNTGGCDYFGMSPFNSLSFHVILTDDCFHQKSILIYTSIRLPLGQLKQYPNNKLPFVNPKAYCQGKKKNLLFRDRQDRLCKRYIYRLGAHRDIAWEPYC